MQKRDDQPLVNPSRRAVLKSLGAAGLMVAAAPLLPGGMAEAAAPTTDATGIDWDRPARVCTTVPTLQVVVNPLIRRGSPIHDNVFRELRELPADYVRFVPWFPYPRLGVAELEPPADGRTSWDFSLIDPMVEDFKRATRGHSTILNFSTIPEWMWQTGWSVSDGELTVTGGDNATANTGFDWTDYTFSVNVTPLATGSNNGSPYAQAGLLFRMAADGSGYAFLVSNYPYSTPAAGGYAVFVTFTGGTVGTVTPTPLPFAVVAGQTYQVAITLSGDTFTLALDGTTVATETHSTVTAGTIGFREDGAESARFADVRVTASDGTVLLSDDFSHGLGQWQPPGRPPNDPNAVDFSYSQGSTLAVPVQTVADYYRRLVGWYTVGGFVDEYGQPHHSGHHYDLPYWEVLNETEHGLSAELYTELYDAIVTEIRKVSPRTRFVGLALAQPEDPNFVRYFLDPANHRPGVPIDMISYHFYVNVPPSETPATWGADGFPQADGFLANVDQIEAVRLELAPHVRTTIDEVGTIASAAATQPNPAPLPDAYWNYSGAIYAYLLANLAFKGIDVVGESQLVGYPSQFPSVSMVDWTTGLPNARYRVLQLMLEQLRPGCGLVPIPPSAVPATIFALGVTGRGRRALLVVNKNNDDAVLPLPGAQRAIARVVDQTSGGGPVRTDQVRGDSYTLGGYGVAVIELY